MMSQNQPQVHISQVLDSLDHPNSNLQSLNQYLITYFLQIIPVKNQSEINRLHQLLNALHLNLQHRYITLQQRRRVLDRLVSQSYHNIAGFENALSHYLDQEISVTRAQKTQTPPPTIDSNQQLIQQLLLQDQAEKRNQEQASLRLVQQMQNKEYQQPEEVIPQPSSDLDMQCPICLQTIKPNLLALLDCNHWFHKNCTFKHFSQCITDRNFPLKCPSCNQEVIFPDIQEYLTYQYKKKYYQYTLQKYLNTNQADLSWCPTPGCEYVFIFDEGMTKFRCPSCLKKYCLKCKQLYHSGMQCKEREYDKKFLRFAKGAKYKECGKCRRWVEKQSGCDHITCLCGHDFCYRCGGNYPKCHCKKEKRREEGQGQGLWSRLFGISNGGNNPNSQVNRVPSQNTPEQRQTNSIQHNTRPHNTFRR